MSGNESWALANGMASARVKAAESSSGRKQSFLGQHPAAWQAAGKPIVNPQCCGHGMEIPAHGYHIQTVVPSWSFP
ncbi:hypothetical protein GCM10027214_22860 [Stenotrophomonas tumulicola]